MIGAVPAFEPTKPTRPTMRSRTWAASARWRASSASGSMGRAGPAQVEHPLVAPFVTVLLEERGGEGRNGILGVDRRRGMAGLDRFDDRRAVLGGNALWIDHERDERQLREGAELRHAFAGAHDPAMRDALVAEIGADLDRIRRHLGAVDAPRLVHAAL